LVAVTVLTTAIVLWMRQIPIGRFADLELAQQIMVAAGISITGFALHEIGHKITAQHFGHWSEFRFSLPGLLATLVMSYFGFLIGAPGATWHTATSPRDNGKISAAGPLINIIIALAAFPLTNKIMDLGMVSIVADGVLLFNAILAAFNLIPFGPLDGKKILKWNPFVYGILVLLTAALFVYARPFAAYN
jgi:Zn-dependent protease